MKKTVKFLSLIFAVVLSLSVFSVMSFAEGSKEDVIAVYESILKNVETKGTIRTAVVSETWTEQDYSFLNDFDQKLTELRDGGDNKVTEKSIEYFDTKNVNETGKNEVYSMFSIQKDFDSYFINLASATNENGVINIVAVDEYDGSKWIYEVKVNENNLIEKYTLTKENYEKGKSVFYKEYNKIEFEKVSYTFSYSEIPVESIELSEKEVSIYYKETVDIIATINPKDASFAELKYVIKYEDGRILDEDVVYATKDGKATIKVTGVGKGVVELKVYTMEDELMDSCVVNVEFKPFDYVRFFFDKSIEVMTEFFTSLTF